MTNDYFDYLDERKHPRHYHAFLGGLFLFAVVFAAFSSVSVERVRFLGFPIPTLCPFKLFTGLDCPACGLTRAVIFALHGHFHESYLMHVWGIPVAFLFLFQIPYRIYRILGGTPFTVPFRVKQWGFYFVLLSLFLPWLVKTAAFLF